MELVDERVYSVQVFLARSVMEILPSMSLFKIFPVERSALVRLVMAISAPPSAAKTLPLPVLEMRPVR